MTSWHRTLAATGERRALGKAITGAANLAFLFLVASGFYLWWPRNWSPTALRNITWFRRRLSGKARDFNWHNVIGFWSALPLFVVVLSGVVISYQWAGNLVYRIAGEKPPGRTAAPAATSARSPRASASTSTTALEPLMAAAEKKAQDWKTLTLTLPTSSAPNVTISIDRGTGGQPQLRSQLVLDRTTAREVRYESFGMQTPGRRARSILRFAHTGEVLGVVGQTVACLASLGGVVLAATGIMLVLRRLWSWRRRRAWHRQVQNPAEPDVDVAA